MVHPLWESRDGRPDGSPGRCHPVAEILPFFSTHGAAPRTVVTTVYLNTIPVNTMLNLVAMSIVFLIVTLAVPYTAAGIVSGTVGLALTHAFEAAYLACQRRGKTTSLGRSKSTSVRDTLPNQVVRLGRVKPSPLTTKSNSAYGIQARSPFLRS